VGTGVDFEDFIELAYIIEEECLAILETVMAHGESAKVKS
jgi:hypothetical protein